MTAALLMAHFGWSMTTDGARLSESGAQTSLINAQEVLRQGDDLDAVLVGSSQSARLSSSFLSESPLTIGSLGMDGQGAGAGLRILLGSDYVPPLVLIEANTLNVLNESNEETVIGSLNGPASVMSQWLPTLRAETRLSSNLYSWAKTKKDGTGSPDSGEGVLVLPTPPPNADVSLDSLDELSRTAIERVDNQVASLIDNGHCVVVYWLPANGGTNDQASLGADYVRSRNQLYYLDMSPLTDLFTYSDAIHLDTPGARQAAHILANSINAAEGTLCS